MLKLRSKRSKAVSVHPADILGFTLPDFLKDPNRKCFGQLKVYQGSSSGWEVSSHDELVEQVDLTTAGLISLGLEQGDRVGFLINSDCSFLALDIACAQANVVSVPIDLSQTIENIIFSLDHSDTKVLFVANLSILGQVLPYLTRAKSLKRIVLLNDSEAQSLKHSCRLNFEVSGPHLPHSKEPSQTLDTPIPPSIGLDLCDRFSMAEVDAHQPFHLMSWYELQTQGKRTLANRPQLLSQLNGARSPQDLATLIYIPHDDGTLKGVMLSHENLTSTALAAFSGMKGLRWGDRESVVTFLPLTHIFARVMLYGHLYYSHTLYFSSPKRIMKHLKQVRPTILSTVPILIHRVFRKLQSYGEDRAFPTHLSKRERLRQWPKVSMKAVKVCGHRWAMAIAQRPIHQSQRFSVRAAIEKRLASLVFRQWRGVFGGRLRYCLSGGAALDAEIARFFIDIGLPIFQGYGLTQTSSVVTFNQPGHNVPGTVGQVRVGAECAIGTDGEVLVKGTGVMKGYFKEQEVSPLVIDEQGWFHTGDKGYLDTQNNLILTGRKKTLFKLTTGKYVTPRPLEETLQRSPLVHRALVIGAERKYCAAILFIKQKILLQEAQKMGLTHYPLDALMENPCIRALYEALVANANCYLPYWSNIQRIQLLQASAYPSRIQSHSQSSDRAFVIQRFSDVIDELYQQPTRQKKEAQTRPDNCQILPLGTCPIAGQSLKTKLS